MVSVPACRWPAAISTALISSLAALAVSTSAHAGPASNDDKMPKPRPTCTIKGTPGPNVIRGTPNGDIICGLGGNDVIYGGGGDDIIFGGAGNDRIFGGSGHDIIYGDSGNDNLRGDDGRDALFGGARNDLLNGGAGRDTLVGGAGKDRRLGAHPSDTFAEDGPATVPFDIDIEQFFETGSRLVLTPLETVYCGTAQTSEWSLPRAGGRKRTLHLVDFEASGIGYWCLGRPMTTWWRLQVFPRTMKSENFIIGIDVDRTLRATAVRCQGERVTCSYDGKTLVLTAPRW